MKNCTVHDVPPNHELDPGFAAAVAAEVKADLRIQRPELFTGAAGTAPEPTGKVLFGAAVLKREPEAPPAAQQTNEPAAGPTFFGSAELQRR